MRVLLMVMVSALMMSGCGAKALEGTPEWEIDPEDKKDATPVPKDPKDPDPKDPDPTNNMPQPSCPNVRVPFTVPATISSTLPAGVGRVDEYPCSTARGNEVVYHVKIERPMAVRIWTTWENQETMLGPVLALRRGCTADTAISHCSGPLSSKPAPQYNGFIQAKVEPGYYTVTLDSRSNDDFPPGGAYTIHLEEATLADNATCAQATSLEADQTHRGVFDLDGTSGDHTTCFSRFTQTHYYKVMVPPQTGLSVDAQYPNMDGRPSIEINTSCTPSNGMCGQGSVTVNNRGPQSLSNQTNDAQEMIIAVSGRQNGPYTLTPRLTPLVTHASCEDALPIVSGETVRDQSFDAGSVPAEQCNGNLRRSLYYSIDLPDEHRLFTYGAGVNLKPSCDAQMCLNSSVNETGRTQRVVLQAFESNISSFDLTAVTVPLAENRVCRAPIKLSDNQRLRDQDIRQGGEGFNVCQLVFPGLVRFYSIPFTLGGPVWQARVRVIPHDETNVSASIQVLVNAEQNQACSARRCVRHDDAYFRGTSVAETFVSYGDVGVGQSEVEVVIAVSMDAPQNPDASPLFDIEVTPMQ